MKSTAFNSTSGAQFNITRRRFLQTASASVAVSALGADALDIVNGKPRRVGLIGCGWYGKSDLWRLIQVAPVEVVSLCDPDKHMLAEAVEIASKRQKSKKQPRTYNDYREMLKAKDLDIVLIGSPDHWHALHALAAIESGAEVYCQKPISRDVREGEAMLDAARTHKRWWRTFTEYGNGIVGDMCVHMLDTARWMLGLGWPKRVTSAGGIYVQKEGKSNISDTQTATFEYDQFNCVWQHRTWGTPPDPDYPWALFIYGENGTLKASTMRADFIPLDKNAKPIHFECLFEREQYPEDVTEKDIELNAAPATRKHMLDFLAAIDKRGRPIADIEEGYTSTASCIR